MCEMISSDEAVHRLAVTKRRVQELVKAGSLEGSKVSGVWIIDADSVDKRGGRPARGKGANELAFTLMNRTHEVAEVVYDARRMEFTALGDSAGLNAYEHYLACCDALGAQGAKEALSHRLPRIREALEWRIERMTDIAKWT